MTDRELLELAAKAAGVEVWFPRLSDGQGGILEPCHTSRNGQTEEWNPLADDGDALRLAVALEMMVTIETCYYASALKGDVHAVEHIGNDGKGCIYAATRRAIVRAAAEIGKGMK